MPVYSGKRNFQEAIEDHVVRETKDNDDIGLCDICFNFLMKKRGEWRARRIE